MDDKESGDLKNYEILLSLGHGGLVTCKVYVFGLYKGIEEYEYYEMSPSVKSEKDAK